MSNRLTHGCFSYTDGQEWYVDGRLHREDGPAIKYCDGTEKWYRHGQLHRVGGPAEIYPRGASAWLQEGLLHRTDGPAIEYGSGLDSWYVRGRQLTEEEFYLYVDHLTGELMVPIGKQLTHDY